MKALIIEDEEIIANVLLNKIKKVAADVDVITILPSLKTARRWFGENAEPDLLFMDIQLSDGVSFDIFNDFSLKLFVWQAIVILIIVFAIYFTVKFGKILYKYLKNNS